jgi:hypothetical protein
MGKLLESTVCVCVGKKITAFMGRRCHEVLRAKASGSGKEDE